jgi:uncharacterized protein (DUF2147 family)
MRSVLLFATTLMSLSQAMAQGPTGEWLVKDRVATIKVDVCDGQLWGIVSWEKAPGGFDEHNPDPTKRNRPTFGMPVILGMKPVGPGLWAGEIYNAENGKTYAGRISMAGPDTLRVEGCILGFLCGGEDWTRAGIHEQTGEAKRGRASPPRSKPIDVCITISRR